MPPLSRIEHHSRSTGTRRPPELVAGTRRSPEVVARLVRSASGGNEHAWAELVNEFEGHLRAVARAHRLAGADAADVAQTTWMRLLEHIRLVRLRRNPDLSGMHFFTFTLALVDNL